MLSDRCFGKGALVERRRLWHGRLSESVEAKQKMFDAFTKKGQGGHAGKKFSREELERMPMTIWEIEIEEMTGREGVW